MFLGDEDGGGIISEIAGEKIETGEGDCVFIGRIGFDRLDDLVDHFIGAFERGAVGQDHRSDVVTLVFVRYQATVRETPQTDGDDHHGGEQCQTDAAAANHPADAVGITPGGAVEPVVEPVEKTVRNLVLVFQNPYAQRRCQRERNKTRDHDGDGDGDRELAVEL